MSKNGPESEKIGETDPAKTDECCLPGCTGKVEGHLHLFRSIEGNEVAFSPLQIPLCALCHEALLEARLAAATKKNREEGPPGEVPTLGGAHPGCDRPSPENPRVMTEPGAGQNKFDANRRADWRDHVDENGVPTCGPEKCRDGYGCQYCGGPLDAKAGIGQYECPWCVARFTVAHDEGEKA